LGGEIRWNFTKFLVDAQGQVIARFASGDSPTSDQVKQAIEAALKSDS
jgi:glutathione peroxidase